MSYEKVKVEQKPKSRSKMLLIIGFAVSVAYLVSLAVYAACEWASMRSLKPNEVGDFFAGAFSPLAFLWLVLGYLQQGEELRNSADALWLQGQELQNSVVQQTELVNVTREQLSLEKNYRESSERQASISAMPTILMDASITFFDPRDVTIKLLITNIGQMCTSSKLYVSNKMTKDFGQIIPSKEYRVAITTQGWDAEPLVPVCIVFTDRKGRRGFQVFEILISDVQGAPRLEVSSDEPSLGEWAPA